MKLFSRRHKWENEPTRHEKVLRTAGNTVETYYHHKWTASCGEIKHGLSVREQGSQGGYVIDIEHLKEIIDELEKNG